MTRALIAFGANVGDVRASFDRSLQLIQDVPEIDLVSVASPVVTKAVSGSYRPSEQKRDPDYLNSALLVETRFSPTQLLHATQAIENVLGRQRRQRWGPRTIDLDILLYGQQIVDRPGLQIPHQRMSFRKFVLNPATEIAADWVDPVSGVTLQQLSNRLDRRPVKIIWVTNDAPSAKISVDSWSNQPQLNDTEVAVDVEVVTDLGRSACGLAEYSLLVFSKAAAAFPDAASRFAGPWLNLSGMAGGAKIVGPKQTQAEVLAAIEAMHPR